MSTVFTALESVQSYGSGAWAVMHDATLFSWSHEWLPSAEFTSRCMAEGGVWPLDDWKRWLEEEIRVCEHDRGEGYYASLEAAWLRDPANVGDPVLIALLPDGAVDIGDGWHRVAMSVVHKAAAVPALVGRYG